MTPKITAEQRKALEREPGKPLELPDDQTQKVYVMVAKDDFTQMVDQELRRLLQIGFDQADAGDVGAWDVEEVLREAHRRHAERPS